MTRSDIPLFFAAHDPQLLLFWRNATIGIAGAGGLGSNIATSLCRSGIGKLIIADFDTVSITNLNRQQFYLDQVDMFKVDALRDNLHRISSFTDVQTYTQRITADNLPDLFGSVDIMIEAFDAADQKQMLIESWLELYPHKPIIAASGIAGVGDNDSLHTIRHGNLYLCGDGSSEIVPGISPMAPRVAIVANMQANLCLDLLTKMKRINK